MTNQTIRNEEIDMLSLSSQTAREPEGRNLYVIGEVKEEMISTVVLPLINLNREDDKLKKREPINIYIYSPGGETWVSLAIIDSIKNSETPVNTICLGYAASAAFYILCAGHTRSALLNSSLMVHTATWGVMGKVPQMRSNMVEADSIEKRLIRFLKEKTLINEQDFKDMSSQEWWMTTEEALEYSVIDKVIGKDDK